MMMMIKILPIKYMNDDVNLKYMNIKVIIMYNNNNYVDVNYPHHHHHHHQSVTKHE